MQLVSNQALLPVSAPLTPQTPVSNGAVGPVSTVANTSNAPQQTVSQTPAINPIGTFGVGGANLQPAATTTNNGVGVQAVAPPTTAVGPVSSVQQGANNGQGMQAVAPPPTTAVGPVSSVQQGPNNGQGMQVNQAAINPIGTFGVGGATITAAPNTTNPGVGMTTNLNQPGGTGQAPWQQQNVLSQPLAGAPNGNQYNAQGQPLPPGSSSPSSAPSAPPPSIEQQALAGGGVDNKQQVSNFLQALQQAGAGSNNTFQNAGNAAAPTPVQNLVSPAAAYSNNGGIVGGNQAGLVQNPTSTSPVAITTPPQGSSLPTTLPANTAAPNYSTTSNNLPPIGGANMSIPDQQMQTMNNLGSSAMGLTSDENLKTDVQSAEPNITDFLNKIGAYNYTYKDPAQDGVGTFTSPMAQELEKTELGKQAVIDTPRGKMVNYPRLGAVNLAAVSVVHRQQQRLQEQFDALKRQMKKKG